MLLHNAIDWLTGQWNPGLLHGKPPLRWWALQRSVTGESGRITRSMMTVA